jgi:hypothetical protein
MSKTGGVQQFIYGELIEPLLQIQSQQKQSFCTPAGCAMLDLS